MIGGIFQGANRPDFSNAVVIHTIDSLPEAAYNFIELETPCCYRYYRYVAPRSSYVNVAEIVFFDKPGKQLQREIIGTDGSYENLGNDKYKAFDGNTLTYFNSSVNTGGWMGMDMKKKTCLKRIAYLPRNDDNFIRKGEIYELFYWNLKGWVSLGKQTGSKETQKLVYRNVPTNSLFLLRNLTKGKEERIFTYKNGKQVWW